MLYSLTFSLKYSLKFLINLFNKKSRNFQRKFLDNFLIFILEKFLKHLSMLFTLLPLFFSPFFVRLLGTYPVIQHVDKIFEVFTGPKNRILFEEQFNLVFGYWHVRVLLAISLIDFFDSHNCFVFLNANIPIKNEIPKFFEDFIVILLSD